MFGGGGGVQVSIGGLPAKRCPIQSITIGLAVVAVSTWLTPASHTALMRLPAAHQVVCRSALLKGGIVLSVVL